MQDVLIEKPYEFIPAIKASWPQKLLLKFRVFEPVLRNRQGVVKYECRNLDLLRQSIAAGHGIMLTPNHPRTADPMAMCYVSRDTPCEFNVMASWHLFHSGWLQTLMLRSMGAFSVNREGLDKTAVDEAIRVLKDAERPLLIFPEGTTSRTNDQLMSLMDGPAFIARTAAKRRAKADEGKVVVHPVGIKYLYEGDIEKACQPVLALIEHKLSWRPQPELPLIQRIIKVGNALLTLKELQYGAETDTSLSFRERQTTMVNHLLHPLEEEWLGERQTNGIATRIKNLRMKIFPDMSRRVLSDEERARRWVQLEDTYLAQQVDCYPDGYITSHSSVDRILEMVEKLEEDLTDTCRIHGKLKVVIDIDEAIEVSPKRERGAKVDPLMAKIRERLELKLSVLQHESRMYT